MDRTQAITPEKKPDGLTLYRQATRFQWLAQTASPRPKPKGRPRLAISGIELRGSGRVSGAAGDRARLAYLCRHGLPNRVSAVLNQWVTGPSLRVRPFNF